MWFDDPILQWHAQSGAVETLSMARRTDELVTEWRRNGEGRRRGNPFNGKTDR
jgi:hypothetical protein